MRRTLLTAALAASLFLGLWCWSFDRYRESVDEALTAQTGGDPAAFTAALERLTKSYAAPVIRELPLLDRRLAFAHGALALSAGKHDEAVTRLTEASHNGEDLLASRALYDLGNLALAKGNLEGARELYIRALTLDPSDLQTKINLELLLQRIKEEQKGRKMFKGENEDLGFLTDYWLRKLPEQEGSGGSSKRIWR